MQKLQNTYTLSELIEDLKDTKYVVIDCESNGKDVRWDSGFELRGVAIAGRASSGEIKSGYYGLTHAGDFNISESEVVRLSRFLSAERHWIAHNARFDWSAIERGLDVPLWDTPYYDTMLMAHWINENDLSKELDYLGKKYVGRGKNSSKLQDDIIKNFGWAFVPYQVIQPYAVGDAILTLELFEKLLPKFIEEGFDVQ